MVDTVDIAPYQVFTLAMISDTGLYRVFPLVDCSGARLYRVSCWRLLLILFSIKYLRVVILVLLGYT